MAFLGDAISRSRAATIICAMFGTVLPSLDASSCSVVLFPSPFALLLYNEALDALLWIGVEPFNGPPDGGAGNLMWLSGRRTRLGVVELEREEDGMSPVG